MAFATYIDDIPGARHAVYRTIPASPVAMASRVGIAARLALPDVRDVVLAQDIPGDRYWPPSPRRRTIFATRCSMWTRGGQAWWWPTTGDAGTPAARAVRLDIEPCRRRAGWCATPGSLGLCAAAGCA